jgi:hypothetical protein
MNDALLHGAYCVACILARTAGLPTAALRTVPRAPGCPTARAADVPNATGIPAPAGRDLPAAA